MTFYPQTIVDTMRCTSQLRICKLTNLLRGKIELCDRDSAVAPGHLDRMSLMEFSKNSCKSLYIIFSTASVSSPNIGGSMKLRSPLPLPSVPQRTFSLNQTPPGKQAHFIICNVQVTSPKVTILSSFSFTPLLHPKMIEWV